MIVACTFIGHFATHPLFQHPLVTSPDPLPIGICGRQEAADLIQPADDLLATILWIILASVASCVALCCAAYALYSLRRATVICGNICPPLPLLFSHTSLCPLALTVGASI